MFYLVKEPGSDDYLLFKTENKRITTLYAYHSNVWLPLSTILLATAIPYNHSPSFRAWKAINSDTIIYSSRSLSGIHKFINNHPELLV